MSLAPSAPGDLPWRAAPCEGGACIMVARQGDAVVFGNTKRPGDLGSSYSLAEWNSFLAAVKRGDFDDLS